MKNEFICPKCRSRLNVDDSIVFTVKKKDNELGLIFLSPELGNYSIKKNDSFTLKEKESVAIFCPICQENLECKENNHKLIRIIMIDENGIESNILFSNVFGEKCTYKIKDKKVEKFGDSIISGVDFEALSMLL